MDRDAGHLEIRLLGPLEVRCGGSPISIGARKTREVLAALALHANELVSTDVLTDELWGDEPPPTARTIIQGHISNLRKLLAAAGAPGRLLTEGGGYRLALGGEETDVARFERLAAEGSSAIAAGDMGTVATRLREADQIWRGSVVLGIDLLGGSAAECARLDARRAALRERRIEADLAIGRHLDVLPELETLVKEEPLNERLRGALALALYRSGRQADALTTLRELRQVLGEELGVDPSPDSRELELSILNQSPALDPPAAHTLSTEEGGSLAETVSGSAPEPAPYGPAAGPELKLGTVLVVRSGDPGAPGGLTRADLDEVVLRHGGRVVSDVGGRTIAIFGIPRQREDDCLRAMRAGVELHLAARATGGEVAIGISTGHLLVHEDETIGALGDVRAVGQAARLAQLAQAGETLLDELSRRLVRRTVETEAAAGRTYTHRLIGLRSSGMPAEPRGRLVGREHELALLEQAYRRVVDLGACHVVSIIGPAGIGKTSLISRFVRSLPARTTTLTGRCLPYGPDITYWPIAEIVRQAAGTADGDDPDEARRKIELLLADEPEREHLSAGIAALLGLSDAALGPDETIRALRLLLRALSRHQPLVVVLDDLHFAEETFLDVLHSVLTSGLDSRVLVICQARMELLDRWPSWGGGKVSSATALLAPLSFDQSSSVVEDALGGPVIDADLMRRIFGASGGNPLYLVEMLAMAVEDGLIVRGANGWRLASDLEEFPVPPTIEALIGARLDHLGPDERAILERAAVIGQEFARDAVHDLLPDVGGWSLDPVLEKLVQREFIQRGTLSGDDEVYAFRHLLIRDVMYERIPPEVRAELHASFAAWIERTAGDRIAEFEEIAGYHLEQAAREHRALGADHALVAELSLRAGEHLASAGHRAFVRNDRRAAVNILGRAVGLLPAAHPGRPPAYRERGAALIDLGRWPEGMRALETAVETAREGGNERELWLARIEELDYRQSVDPIAVTAERLLALAEEAVNELARLDHPIGIVRALRAKGDALQQMARWSEASAAYLEGAAIASRLGNERELAARTTFVATHGPMPVPQAIPMTESLLHPAHPEGLNHLAYLYAMDGRFEKARELLAEGDQLLRDFGLDWLVTSNRMYAGVVHLLAADFAQAEQVLDEGATLQLRMGDLSEYATTAALLAQAVYEQGRPQEAELLSGKSEESASIDDFASQVGWRGVRAKVLADRGEYAEARSLAQAAVSLITEADWPNLEGDAHLDYARVLLRADDPAQASAEARAALAAYERKGNRVMAARAQLLLAHMEGTG